MKFSKRTWMLLAGIAAALAFAATAVASVTFDPTCSLTPSNGTGACGFVGKGDVQLALGLNNAKMQQQAGSLKFTDSQAASEALTQAVTQAGTQDATRTVTCTDTAGLHTFYIDGYREGTRTGSQTGSVPGTQYGTVGYSIDYDPRIHNQVDGFVLKSVTATGFVASGDPVFGDPTMNDDWTWGTASFTGQWYDASDNTAIPSPVCLSGDPNVSDVTDNTTYGDITPGDITPVGSPVAGAVTPTGTATLYVNGVALNY